MPLIDLFLLLHPAHEMRRGITQQLTPPAPGASVLNGSTGRAGNLCSPDLLEPLLSWQKPADDRCDFNKRSSLDVSSLQKIQPSSVSS